MKDYLQNLPKLCSEDQLTITANPSEPKQGVVELSNKYVLQFAYGKLPIIVTSQNLNDGAIEGEEVSLSTAAESIGYSKMEDTFQGLCHRIPELTESEREHVYSNEGFATSEQGATYYFHLLKKLNLDTYIRR